MIQNLIPDLSALRPEVSAKVKDLEFEYRREMHAIYESTWHAQSLLESMKVLLETEATRELMLKIAADDDPWKDEPN